MLNFFPGSCIRNRARSLFMLLLLSRMTIQLHLRGFSAAELRFLKCLGMCKWRSVWFVKEHL